MIYIFVWLLFVGALESRIIRSQRAASCSWEGHCTGDSCTTDNDCNGLLSCSNGKCSDGSAQVATCSWEGHCAGDSCSTDNDCNGLLSCSNGKCGDGSAQVNTCSWKGHCSGDPCSTNADCDESLICSNSTCGNSGSSGSYVLQAPPLTVFFFALSLSFFSLFLLM